MPSPRFNSFDALCRPLGIVSNCWQKQLASGQSLKSLIETAAAHGYGCVELRAGALGDFELDGRFDVDGLASLADQLPNVQLSLAIPFPVFDPDHNRPDYWENSIGAARAIAGAGSPRLRVVDLTTSPEAASAQAVRAGERLAERMQPLLGLDMNFLVENAREPFAALDLLVSTARQELGVMAHRLAICYDACNLLLAADSPHPDDTIRTLCFDRVAMVHFKQSSEGRILTRVRGGQIDWSMQLSELAARGYAGPALFEIAPSDNVWTELDASRRYLESLSPASGAMKV